MAIERWRDANGQTKLAREVGNQFRQIALQMDTQREEVREHENIGSAGGGKIAHGIREARIALEKCSLVERPRALARRIRRYNSYCVIS